MAINIVGLHGFWGDPAEFWALQGEIPEGQFWVPDLFERGPLDPTHDFASWTQNFLSEMEQRYSNPPILVGYSQGGRLALHALCAKPELFSRVILLSTHPGQLEGAAVQDRKAWLDRWILKFRTLSDAELAGEWNNQDVFKGTQGVPKAARNRDLLCAALENWSLLHHRFGWEELRRLPPATQWVFGALDLKFLAVKKELERHNVAGEKQILEGSGHRLLMDAPEKLKEFIQIKGV